MDKNTEDDFYGDLQRGNAVLHQQARNNIMLAITSQVTNLIMSGDETDKASELMKMLKDIKEDDQ